MTSLFLITVGAFIGWQFPQPAWAKTTQDFIIAKFKSFFSK